MSKTKLSISATLLLSLASQAHATCKSITEEVPVKAADFGEPDWKAIIETAFPVWATPPAGCPRLDKVGGSLVAGYETFPTPEADKFNPCYYTKAFAGLDPMKGGYPTPIDTHYPYEFAAPFFMQPGDGSTHHCPINSPKDTKIQSCPKVKESCGPDCLTITDKYGIGHIPPFVTLNAVKKGYYDCAEDICQNWFDFNTNGCNIKPSKLDELIFKEFSKDGDKIQYGPPKLGADGNPSPFYYELEYLGDCKDCFGPHYCSEEAAAEEIWGDFCPYVHVGENAGQYRHPHIALAAFELWIANKCMPQQCPSEWLKSPNGKGYKNADEKLSTSITWSAMVNENDPISQPAVPYVWPNKGEGIFPGHELYGEGKTMKEAPGVYVTALVAKKVESAAVSTNATGFWKYITFASFLVLSLV
jgi:hypothetical protein